MKWRQGTVSPIFKRHPVENIIVVRQGKNGGMTEVLTCDMDDYDKIRQQSWDRALHSFGTGHIFQRRADLLRDRLKYLSFSGLIVPLLVGGVVLSFGTDYKYVHVVLTVAGIASVAQLALSAWALTSDWQNSYAYAIESSTANRRLSKRFETLGSNPPKDLPNLQKEYQLLEVEDQARRDLDSQRGLTSQEERAGMRVALRKFRRECASCGEVPQSTQPTTCSVCGKFPNRLT